MASVHPHACGDDKRHFLGGRHLGGSPPRVWGRSLGDFLEDHCIRFTPTRVGTILDCTSSARCVSPLVVSAGTAYTARNCREWAFVAPIYRAFAARGRGRFPCSNTKWCRSSSGS
jgi:hypothetical protein